MFEAFFSVFSVFFLISIGYFLQQKDILPEQTGDILGLYVLRVALPLLIFHVLANANPADFTNKGFWAAILLSQAIPYILGFAADRIFCRRGEKIAHISALACSSCNAAFVGFPIVANLFPNNAEALFIAGITMLIPNIVVVPAQVRLDIMAQMHNKNGKKSSLWAILNKIIFGNTLLLATLAGFILSFSGIGLWKPLDDGIALVGVTASPCMLLALGFGLQYKLRLAMERKGGLALGRQSWFMFCKLIIQPLLCWAFMLYFGVSGLWLVIGVLMSATATALVASVVAQVYDAVPEEAMLTAILSHAVNIFTLTGFIWAFKSLGMM